MKKKIRKTLLDLRPDREPTWKDIKSFNFEDDDLIHCAYEEGFYSENNSYEGGWVISVDRMVEETDAEYNKRIEKTRQLENDLKERRYQHYLTLKKEFENDNS